MANTYIVELVYRQFVSVEAGSPVEAVSLVEEMDDLPLPECHEIASITSEED